MRRWIEDGEANGLEFGTVRGRSIIKKLHIDPFIGADKLSALTVPRLHEFDAKLRDGGRSLDLRRKALSHLKTMLSFVRARGLLRTTSRLPLS
jgi:integrase